MSVPVDSLVGKAFGPYRPGQLLGRGSLSTVYVAQQLATGRTVMLSLFTLPQNCTGRARERFMERFMRVASEVRRLSHPHIVPLYDFGEQSGYPYLVAPLREGGTLATHLQREGRCSPELTLELLRQIAAALDYAHQNQVVHGSLKPSAILIDNRQTVQIAGFGLAQMLAMQGVGHIQHSHPHLFSVAGTLLASPTYLAPEVVQGAPADARADIYALGIMLFEMFTGRPPFTGDDPLQVAAQHVTQRVPSLLSINPELPPALDLVLQRAIEREPARRVLPASKLVGSFERVLNLIQAVSNPSLPTVAAQENNQAVANGRPVAGKQWIPMPGTSGRMPAVGVATASAKMPAAGMPIETGKWPRQEPQFPATDKTAAFKAPQGAPAGGPPLPPVLQDPARWGKAGVEPTTGKQAGAMDNGREPGRKKSSRRSILVATGTIVAAGAVGIVGYNLLPQMRMPGNQGKMNIANTPQTGQQGQQTPMSNQQQTKPAQMANVLAASGELAVNSSKNFTAPGTNTDSILIHLPDGRYVAYDRACTHQQVAVNYNPNTHMLECPAHGSVFDPSKDAAVVQGPAQTPLKEIMVKVNQDGSVSTA